MVVHSGGSSAPRATAPRINSSRSLLCLLGNFSSTLFRRACFCSGLSLVFESSISCSSSRVTPAPAAEAAGVALAVAAASVLVLVLVGVLQPQTHNRATAATPRTFL